MQTFLLIVPFWIVTLHNFGYTRAGLGHCWKVALLLGGHAIEMSYVSTLGFHIFLLLCQSFCRHNLDIFSLFAGMEFMQYLASATLFMGFDDEPGTL